MRYAIDCGHGQNNTGNGRFDPGAVGNGYKEHDIVTGMGKRVSARLMAAGQSVLLLESGPYWTRDDAADRWGVQRYLSIHCDASTSSSASGTSVWINRSAPQGVVDAAERLGRAVASAIGIGWRGVHRKDFGTLGGAAPDMLLEMFFISNADDVRRFQVTVDKVEAAITDFMLWWGGVKPETKPTGGGGDVAKNVVIVAFARPGVAVTKAIAALEKLGLRAYVADADDARITRKNPDGTPQ